MHQYAKCNFPLPPSLAAQIYARHPLLYRARGNIYDSTPCLKLAKAYRNIMALPSLRENHSRSKSRQNARTLLPFQGTRWVIYLAAHPELNIFLSQTIKMTQIQGNLLDLAKQGHFDVIAHGCNCFCTFGAGLAKSMREQFPQAYQADLKTAKGSRAKMGSLSQCTVETAAGTLLIANLYTQFYWGAPKLPEDSQDDRYQALESSLQELRGITAASAKVGLPRIGAGLAGGSWPKILDIIKSVFPDATIVSLPSK